MLRRGTAQTLDDALTGIERAVSEGSTADPDARSGRLGAPGREAEDAPTDGSEEAAGK